MYCLVNQSKREVIWFNHLPASSKREIGGNNAASAVTAWYLLENIGDNISFMADSSDDWPFTTGRRDDLAFYEEVSDKVVDALIAAKILRDDGREMYFEDAPHVYCRQLHNIWMDT